MNIRRWIAGALGVVAAGAAVYIVMAPREPRLVFDPASGESHHYRVGNRVVVDIDGRELDHTVQSHGIVTYGVTERSPLHLHAGIDLLNLTVNDQPVLASADLGGRDREVAEALRDGFDVTLADNGQLHMQPVNAAAFERLSEQFEKVAENPLAQAMLGPAVPPGVVARQGATTTLDNFQGFEGLTLTVDALDDAHAWLRVEGQIDTLAADASLIQRLAPPDTPIDVSDVHVSARMTVERKHGWIEDMTLVTRLRMAANDKAATMRSITYAHRRDNLTAGSVTASLDGFARLPNAFTEGSELMLAQYSSAFLPPPMYTPPDRFDPPEAAQELSAYPGGVMLYLDGGNARELPYGSIEVQDVALYDAHGERLPDFLAFDTMQYYGEEDGGWLINLLPLGWDEHDVSAVAEARAEIGYRQRSSGEPVTLVLDDQRHVLENGDARAIAEPIADADNAWQITLSSGGDTFYWLDPGALPEGVTGQGLLADPTTGWNAAEQMMLARNDNPRAWQHTLRIEAELPTLELPLQTADNGQIVQTETVRFVGAQYDARNQRPDSTRHLDTPLLSERDLSLADIAPEDDGRGGLRLDVPVGLDPQCGISAWVKRADMPARLWRKTDTPDAVAEQGRQRWHLTLMDGAHADVSDLALDTVLRCPGTPTWKRLTVDSDTPWLIDLPELTGRWPQSTGTAGDYFDTVQFLDADDRPLRPMLRSGEYSGADWADEAAQHGLRDYIYEDGHIRIWGDVASVLTLAFEPPAIEKSWPHRPGHNAASANDDPEKTP
ncbi:hypothetical protein T5B8_03296 [Salinisphaera sp. T5B8]|uniref:hypothetical protein n=1 Tax=Salinisphaera sp. T5B8 TaxID=1304154 RepID=UPI0033401A91